MIVRNHMAILMNLRNVAEAGISPAHIAKVDRALRGDAWARGCKALPFRYLSAAQAAPQFADALNTAMLSRKPDFVLGGRTLLVVDVSGSMDAPLSERSTLNRVAAASALAIYLREVCEVVRVFTFSDRIVEVPNVRGIPLHDAITRSQPHSSTYLARALDGLAKFEGVTDRTIVVTDEQTHDGIRAPFGRGYLMNVAPYAPGLVTTDWTRINGWSERLVDWVMWEETGAVSGSGESEIEYIHPESDQ